MKRENGNLALVAAPSDLTDPDAFLDRDALDEAFPADMSVQLKRYRTLEAMLLEKHLTGYIAVTDDDYIGPFAEMSEALHEAVLSFGDVPMLIHQIGQPFKTATLS